MAETTLDLDLVKGETFVLSMVLSDAGVAFDLTGYSVHFAIVEDTGVPPVVDVDSVNNPTVVVIVPALGQIDITLPYTQTKLEFTKGKYSVALKSGSGTVTYLLLGDLNVIIPAEVLA